MTLINTMIPGCSYSAGSFTIPISALNTALTTNWDSSEDNAEKLLYSLLECLRVYEATTPSGLKASLTSTSVSIYPWSAGADSDTNNSVVRSITTSFSFIDTSIETGDVDNIGSTG